MSTAKALRRATSAARRICGRLARDKGGATAVTVALSVAVLAPVTLGVVDVYMATEQKSKLQDALDAAALSAARSNGQTDAAVDQVGEAALRANLALIDGAELVNADFRIVDGTKIVAAAGVRLPSLGPIFQQGTVNVAAEVQRAGKIEVALVLDNTGSMSSNSKLAYLQSAAKSLVDKLVAASANSTDPNPLKISLVPFSTTVRVHTTTTLTNYNTNNPGLSGIPAWIDPKANAHWTGATNNDIFASKQDRFQLMKNIGQPWNGCVEARRAPYDVTEDASVSTTPATMWVPYFYPDERGTRGNASDGYYNSYLDDGSSGTTLERLRNVSKYAVGATVPTGSFQGMKYGPNGGCELQRVMPLGTNFAEIKTAIDNMKAVGETNIPLGLQWGWLSLSPTSPLASKGQAYETKDLRKIVVLMTDGDNTFMNTGNGYGSFYGGLGYIFQGILSGATQSTNDAGRTTAMNDRLAQLCTNMKAKKITIYTVRVEVTTGTSTLLRNCASSPDKFYDVKNASGLGAAFDAIAASIQNLRLSS